MAQYEIKFNKQNGWSYEEGEIPVETCNYEVTIPQSIVAMVFDI